MWEARKPSVRLLQSAKSRDDGQTRIVRSILDW